MGAGLHPALSSAHYNRFASGPFATVNWQSLCELLQLCLQEALSSMLIAGILRGEVRVSYG